MYSYQLSMSYQLSNQFFVSACFPFPVQPGDFSLSVKAPDRVKHFKIMRSDKKFCIGQRKFDSLDDLVDHYKRSPIFTGDDGVLKLYLTRPKPVD